MERFRIDGRRIEQGQVDAARNDREQFWAKGIGGEDVVCRRFRIGDHHIAAGHDGIVPAFQRRPRIIDAVVSRHEMHTGLARGEQCAPGRGARSCVNDSDIFAADQFCQGAGIGEQLQRVFCIQRQAHEFTAHGLKLGFEPAAFAGDQRATSRGSECAREIDGGSLCAAGIQ